MNKKIYIGLAVFLGVLAVVIPVSLFVVQRGKYQSKIQTVNDKISGTNQQIATLANDKDTNDYLPTDVVKNFMNELKNDSKDMAKLYVVEAKKNQDFGKWLSLPDLTEVVTTDTSYTVSGDTATVSYDGYSGEEAYTFSRVFKLVKEDAAWRITDIEES